MQKISYDPSNNEHNDSSKYTIKNGSVLDHIIAALNASPYDDPVINLAIMLHDLGKATTYELKDGYKHSYHGHEAAGVPIVQNIFKRLVFPDLSAEDKKNILIAVEKHMMIHNIESLNIKTLTKLINDPSWEVLKAVSYCDEASRGSPLFNEQKFNEKIKNAEEKVAVLGNAQELKKKIAAYIDGHKLMSWFPELQATPRLIGKVLPTLQDHVLQQMNAGVEISDVELYNMAEKLL